MNREHIAGLVQYMHDGICACGGQCRGYETAYTDFVVQVERIWGSSYQVDAYLAGLELR